jgi:hypothetical protein
MPDDESDVDTSNVGPIKPSRHVDGVTAMLCTDVARVMAIRLAKTDVIPPHKTLSVIVPVADHPVFAKFNDLVIVVRVMQMPSADEILSDDV